MPMSRRVPLIVIALVVAGVAVWAFLPKRAANPGSPADLEPYAFANKLPEFRPPLTALAPNVLADPVKRTAARIEWGPPDVFYWAASRLPADPADRDALARALLAELEKVLASASLSTQRLIDALAVLAEPVARSPLMRIAEAPPPKGDFLQVSAVRALAKYPRDEEIMTLFAKLSTSPSATVRHAVMTEVMKSEELGDARTLSEYLDASEGSGAVPFLQQVGARKLVGCADACARHLDSELPRARQSAIYALLSIRDPRGFAAGSEELARPEPERVTLAITLFRDASAPPPIERARALLDSPDPTIRRELASAMGPWYEPADEEAALQLLRRLAADGDPSVRKTAVHQHWKHGKQEAVEEWRERLRNAHGAALREAAQFLGEMIRDPAAAPILRDRLAKVRRSEGLLLDGADQANLLNGLRHVGGLEDAPEYVERILRAGTPQDVRASERTFLSEYA